MTDNPCDVTECYVRWQNWNAERDMYLDRALIAEAELERLRNKWSWRGWWRR